MKKLKSKDFKFQPLTENSILALRRPGAALREMVVLAGAFAEVVHSGLF